MKKFKDLQFQVGIKCKIHKAINIVYIILKKYVKQLLKLVHVRIMF